MWRPDGDEQLLQSRNYRRILLRESLHRLTVAVESPSTIHEIPMQKLTAWLESGGKSPNEQATKVRLREMLAAGKTPRNPAKSHDRPWEQAPEALDASKESEEVQAVGDAMS